VGNTANADAGTSFTIAGPNGSKTVTGGQGKFSSVLSATGAFLSPGNYTISGTGGADIGAISAVLGIPPAPILTNPANFNLPAVTRSSGLIVTWNPFGGAVNPPGAANAFVEIQVSSSTGNNSQIGATAICDIPASAGKFTIPAYVLQALPAGNLGGFQIFPKTESSFTATGLNLGLVTTTEMPTFIGFVLK
jgi:hypothetical protein